MNKPQKNTFKRKLIVTLLTFSILLTAVIGALIGIYYKQTITDNYANLAYSYAKTAAQYIDGDKVLNYIETGEKDDYYNSIMKYLNSAQKNTNVLYYYVFVPYDDDLAYVWDADNLKGACELGEHENYMAGGKEASLKAMNGTSDGKMSLTDDGTYGYIGSVYYPICNSMGESVALVGVDISMPDVNKKLFNFIGTMELMILVAIAVVVCALYVIITKSLIKPIEQFNVAAKSLVKNLDGEAKIEFEIKDSAAVEIKQLSDSVRQMYAELKDYIKQLENITAEKERIGAELSVATHIQSSMLPYIFPAFPDRKEFDVYATMTPAKEVGGDFYDFFMVDNTHIAIVMADVSGKGVPAALFMVIGKTLIKDHTVPGCDLGEVFTQVNDLLCESNSEGLFITAFEGVLDLKTGDFRYVNAGHEIPFICKNNGLYQPHKIKAGFVLAGMEGIKYKTEQIKLEPGDKIFQYTDGVTEATDSKNHLYGMQRLEMILQKNSDKAPMELLPEVKKNIDEFTGEAEQFDDITMLCLEFREYSEDSE